MNKDREHEGGEDTLNVTHRLDPAWPLKTRESPELRRTCRSLLPGRPGGAQEPPVAKGKTQNIEQQPENTNTTTTTTTTSR